MAAAVVAAVVFAMDVLPTRAVEEEEDATEPPVEFRRGWITPACWSTCGFIPLITSKRCSGFVLFRGADVSSGLVRIGLVDGRDLVSEGRGRDLGGREEGLEEEDLEEEGLEEEDKEGLEDDPKDVDGPSFVLRSENSRTLSNEGRR